MPAVRPLRELTLHEPRAEGGRRFLAAGSGLVQTGDFLYVIADDERELAVFPAGIDEPGRLRRFLPGDLPADPGARKEHKPDLEALALLPAHAELASGALLALESGSRPQRRGGVLWPLGERGELASEPLELDVSPLYRALERELPDLNLEGATVVGERLLLFQRGNGRAGVNAVVALELAAALAELRTGTLGPGPLRDVRRYDLGEVDGVRLCFSDAASLPDDRVVFSAVAEAGEDTYLDGACVAAGVGVLDASGNLAAYEPVEPIWKVEGVEAHSGDGGGIELLLVADADDPAKPSPLLAATLEA